MILNIKTFIYSIRYSSPLRLKEVTNEIVIKELGRYQVYINNLPTDVYWDFEEDETLKLVKVK